MTYWGYHLIFTLPLIAVLFFLVRKKINKLHIGAWLMICFIAFTYTTPWDNYAAAAGIWGFGENVSLWYPFRHLADTTALLGHIPFEEYSYFIIETTLACLFAMFLMKPPRDV